MHKEDKCLAISVEHLHYLFKFCLTLLCNSRYLRYAIWPRGGACHANHAGAVLTVSRSGQLAFVSLKMYTGITKILEFEYKTCMF